VVSKSPHWDAFWSQVGHEFSEANLIDWLTIIVPCENHGHVNGGHLTSITPDGEIDWEVDKKAQIRGSVDFNIKRCHF
jgi:hypothetical protein